MNFKKYVAVVCTVLVLMFAFSACSQNTNSNTPTVAVITKGTTSDFWKNLKSGVDSAATEYNLNVSFNGPDNEEDYETQNKLINNAVDAGADVIVLSAIDYDKNAEAVKKAASAGVKIIMIDSDVDFDKKQMFIGTDNYKAGASAAQAALKLAKGKKLSIGIINHNENTDNGRKRLQGFLDVIDQSDNADVAVTVNVKSNTKSATDAAVKLLKQNPDVNALVGFNEWTTLGVGNAISQLNLSGKVFGIGFDSNIKSVSLLETGGMDALIVQNPFSIGYIAVSSAAKLMSGEKVDSSIETSIYTVTSDNMFNEDIQKILFTFN